MSIFGSKKIKIPPAAAPVTKKVSPLKRVQQSEIAAKLIMKELAKRRKATLLSRGLGEAQTRRQRLGAGAA